MNVERNNKCTNNQSHYQFLLEHIYLFEILINFSSFLTAF